MPTPHVGVPEFAVEQAASEMQLQSPEGMHDCWKQVVLGFDPQAARPRKQSTARIFAMACLSSTG